MPGFIPLSRMHGSLQPKGSALPGGGGGGGALDPCLGIGVPLGV